MKADLCDALLDLVEECILVLEDSPVTEERDIAPPPTLDELRGSDLYALVQFVEACFEKTQPYRGLPRESDGYEAWQSVFDAIEEYYAESDARKKFPHAKAYYRAIGKLRKWSQRMAGTPAG